MLTNLPMPNKASDTGATYTQSQCSHCCNRIQRNCYTADKEVHHRRCYWQIVGTCMTLLLSPGNTADESTAIDVVNKSNRHHPIHDWWTKTVTKSDYGHCNIDSWRGQGQGGRRPAPDNQTGNKSISKLIYFLAIYSVIYIATILEDDILLDDSSMQSLFHGKLVMAV